MIPISFQAPVADDAWDRWLADAQDAVDSMVPGPGGVITIKPALYKRERERLLNATHYKCAYCELRLPPGQRKGDVEHYRPKGRVRGRDGKVVKIMLNGVEIDHPGYYWLAYDYTNLLPCCSACNRRAADSASGGLTGKSDIFPTLDDHWASTPEEVASEKPALINPWLPSDNPSHHLAFDTSTGRVIGLTERGQETERLLGLNREGLPEARLEACRAAVNAMRHALSDAPAARADPEDVKLLESVRDGSAQFAAFCRRRLREALVLTAPLRDLLDQI